MTLTVVGCGKMGLPLAVQAASRGFEVIGVDTNPAVVDAINRGRCPVEEPGIKAQVRRFVRAGRLKASTDLRASVAASRAVIVIVPVLLDRRNRADLTNALSVARGIARSVKKGTIVSFEMTLPVGTTRDIIAPILEKSGLALEKDLYLVFSPERVKSATVLEQIRSVPKVVGAYGPRSLRKGIGLYKSIFPSKIVNVGTLENAEMVKLAGMIYRDVNIALSNEIAKYCDKIGVDLNGLIPVINTDGEANMLLPGIGVGGHCTPVYPYFMINEARRRKAPQLLASMARKINDAQAEHVMNRLKTALGTIQGSKILMMGLGFRPDVKEDTKSPAYLLKDAIARHGGRAFIHDPLYTGHELRRKGFSVMAPGDGGRLDAVILVTAHRAFSKQDWRALRRKGVKVFIDGRNRFAREEIERHGIKYIGIGKGAE